MDVTDKATSTAPSPAALPTATTPQPGAEVGADRTAALSSKWAVDSTPEATAQAIAEARAYAEAHVEMVIPKRRGRPRKHPLPEGAEVAAPPPVAVPKKVSIPKFKALPKPKAKSRRKKKKRDDDDDFSEDSEGDFVPDVAPRRAASSGRRAAFFSDGDADSDDDAIAHDHDASIANAIANQRVSLRQRKRLNYADQFQGDDTDDEEEIMPPKRRPAPKKSASAAPVTTGGRPRASSMGDLAMAAAHLDDDDDYGMDDEDEEEEYNKPTKTGLVPDMAYRSVQIEKILAYRVKKVPTPDDPHSFPTEQPNNLAGPKPPPEGTAAAFAFAARASGGLKDVLMTVNTHIPGWVNPSAQVTPAPSSAPSTAPGASADASHAPSLSTSLSTPHPLASANGATNGAVAATHPLAGVAPGANPSAMDVTTDAPAPTTAPTTMASPKPLKIVPIKPLYPPPKPLETHPLLTPGLQYEFLVKYKQRSFVHAEWVPQVVIERAKLGKQRLQRFLAKEPECDPDLPFEPEYLEVDRVLDREERDGVLYYFVKWNGLPYNECTWESSDEVADAHAVAEYERHNTEPDVVVDYNAPTPRPAPGEWREKTDVAFKDGNQLRPYQAEGMNWLRFCWYNRRNSILADEMGLGKTVQTVSMLWYLYKYRNVRGPFMIIAPLSTIPHWRRELENWTDMNCIVYHGNSEAREILRDYEFYYLDNHGRPKLRNMFKFHVIVTTYEMILTDSEILRPIRWKYIAIDEAHRLKNKASRVLNEFVHFYYDHLLLLTGTPIQNNTQELWTLLNLLDPIQFNSAEDFVTAFGNLKDAEQVKRLHDILKPFLLRRMKDDVDKTIAPKEETIIEVELTTIQKKYYRAVLERSFDNLVQGSKTRSALPSLLNIMMQLRKCCNHPYLLKGVEETELGIHEENNTTPGDTLVESSGKLVLIDKLLPRLKQEGHKILIFSQMVRVIDILQEYLNTRGYKFERIDGAVRGNDRQAAIDRFSKPDSDIFVFLLCTRAGGVGINLTAADTVIIFDSDWNPQNDLQAQARCHRIGQQKSVKVYRLLTRGTYERVMFERASMKLGLDQAVFARVNDAPADEDGGRPKFTSAEVDALLKHGAYDLFREDDNASDKFREENIEDILQSRTTRIVHDSASQAGSSFSKASFTSEHADTDLDVNDPDFWKKVMPHQAARPNPNIIEQPRQRKQRTRLAPDLIENSEDEAALEELSSDEDQGANDSDDELFEDFEGERKGRWNANREKGEQKRKPAGPILHRRKWNMTQRNRFVRAIQLVGFGRWREIKRNAKLNNKSLWEIACYGRAYVRILLRYSPIAEGDTEEKLIQRIINCDDGIEDLSEDPWVSTSKRQMASYELHKQESEEGVPPEMIKAAEERWEARQKQLEATKAAEKVLAATKIEMLKNHQTDELQKSLMNITLGGGGPSPAANMMNPDAPPEELPVTEDPPIVIHWHLNNSEAIAAEVSYFADEDPLMTDTRFLDNTKSTASQSLKRLELLSEVGNLVRSNFGEFHEETFPRIEGGDPAFFTDKWLACHDRDLLVGTWRWGFGQYDRMVRDPILSYYGFFKPKPVKERNGKGDDDDDDEEAGAGDDEDGGEGKKKKTLKKTASKKKLEPVTPLSAASPAPGSVASSSTAMDIDQAAPTAVAPVTENKPQGQLPLIPGVDDPSTLMDLPPSKLLTHRVKHLLKAFSGTRRKRNQSEQKEKKRLEKEKEKEEKHKRKADKETSWSKRERGEFMRVIQANGIPLKTNPETGALEEDWEFMHTRSDKLHNKSAQALARFYEEFKICCRFMAFQKKNPDEKADESLLNGFSEAQLTEKANELHLTGMAAKRIWERIMTFDSLRRNLLPLPNDVLEAKLARATTAGYNLSAWWVNPQFDVGLLRAVDKYGFGRWSFVCTDPAFPFMEAAKTQLGPELYAKASASVVVKPKDEDEDEEKEAVVEEESLSKDMFASFMPAEKFLSKRVQYLVSLALNEVPAPSPARVNGKKHAPVHVDTAAAASSSNAMDVEEEKPTKKRKQAPEHSDLPESVPKRPRLHATDDIHIQLDANGQVIMPITIKGVLTIEKLGAINPSPAFYSEKYIWPVGFVSYREYSSAVVPDGRTKYKCEILTSPDGSAPLFRVTAQDDPSITCEASSASMAWKLILDHVNKAKQEASKRSSVSGPEYFGYGNPKVAELIAKLPGAEACVKYHAAQVPVVTPKRKKRERAGAAVDEEDDMEGSDEVKRRKLTEEE